MSTSAAVTGSNAQIFTLVARRVEEGTEYRVRMRFVADGGVRVAVSKVVDGTVTDIGEEVAVAGLTRVLGEPIELRAQVRGKAPATIQVRAWAASKPEPTGWVLTRTDTEPALEAAGSVGVRASLSGLLANPVTFSVDRLSATAAK